MGSKNALIKKRIITYYIYGTHLGRGKTTTASNYQEWTTFKSDDQKRWSNYTLAQDEQHREMNRELESFGDRITNLETLIKSLQDDLDQVGRENLKRMQAQLMAVRESIEAYNKIFKS